MAGTALEIEKPFDSKQDPAGPAVDAPASGAPTAPAAVPASTQTCANCGSSEPWGLASWCPKCGFYPKLGNWSKPDGKLQKEEDTSPPKFFLFLIPAWAWIMASGVLVIILFSIVGNLVTDPDGWERTIWALAQFGIGSLCFLGAHIWCFISAITRTDRFGILDVLLKPVGIWMPTIDELPTTKHRVWLGAWGLSATIFALMIVGGIRYSALFDDWGFKGPGNKKVAATVLEKRRKEREPKESLEQAKKDLAEKARIEEAKEAQKKKDSKFLKTECVVFGYTEKENGEGFDELLLASVTDKNLRYVGTLSANIPDEIRLELNQRLLKIARERPFVRCGLSARWVEPVILFQVKFKSWDELKQMKEAIFDKLLDDIR